MGIKEVIDMKDKFKEQLCEFGIDLTTEQEDQFQRYFELLTEWNRVMNLTSISEQDEVYEKHFADSLAVAKFIDMNSIHSLIDIGTGAGFPGIPLKIAFPHLKVTLLDSLNKRVRFLNTVIDELRLEKIDAFHGRAEEFAKKESYRESYDLSVSRAVAALSILSEYCIPFVNIGGYFVAYKSSEADDEINRSTSAFQILGGDLKDYIKFQIPYSEIGRSFVVIEKKKKTPGKYPRKAGTPAKEPL